MPRLSGIIPPVSTPFTADLDIDEASLRRLVDHLVEGGVHGLFALGSTSKVYALPAGHRRRVAEIVCDQAAGRVPVLAGVIDMTPLRVRDHVAQLRDLPLAGLVVTAPYYVLVGPGEVENHFRAVKEAVPDLPLYAYDIPACVGGTKLSADLLLRLGAEGVLAGVKDSSGADAATRKLLLARRAARLDDFVVLSGSELTADAALFDGADGVVPGLANVDPRGYVRLYELCRAGDWEQARVEQERLCGLFAVAEAANGRVGGGSAGHGGFKAALEWLGVFESGRMAPPAVALDDTERKRIYDTLVTAHLLAG
ncbi:MAG TPA: dihydrodipicolinate synthase family protein [Propionibacteriaceae bacterium]|nr:dihydrodipicolinate synthase family protein [Propionibacteriaceae bacterium]